MVPNLQFGEEISEIVYVKDLTEYLPHGECFNFKKLPRLLQLSDCL
jgi:hypothetical protein